jgi:lysophospholipase L1-like esterase
MRVLRRGALGPALVAGAALVAAGLAAELALRAVLPIGDLRLVRDRGLIFRVRPGAVSYFRDLETGRRFRAAYDARGMREPAAAAPGGRPLVIVYGDSFIEAVSTAGPHTFSERLQEELRALGWPTADVRNAGVTGYGPDQELRRMAADAGDLRPDAAVWCIFAGNDHGDLVRNRLVDLSAGGTLVWREPVLAPALEKELASAERALYRSELLKRIMRHGPGLLDRLEARLPAGRDAPGLPAGLTPIQATTYRQLRLGELDYAAYLATSETTNLLIDHSDIDMLFAPEAPGPRRKRALLRAVLAEAAATLPRPVPLLVVVVPLDFTFQLRCEDYASRPDLFPRCSPRALSDSVREAAAAAGIPVLDLFPLVAPDAAKWFLPGDGHWSHEGHRRAARIVARALLESGLLRPPG